MRDDCARVDDASKLDFYLCADIGKGENLDTVCQLSAVFNEGSGVDDRRDMESSPFQVDKCR